MYAITSVKGTINEWRLKGSFFYIDCSCGTGDTFGCSSYPTVSFPQNSILSMRVLSFSFLISLTQCIKNKAFHGKWNERVFSEFQKYYQNSAKIKMVKVSRKSIISWELCLFRCVPKRTSFSTLFYYAYQGKVSLVYHTIMSWMLFLQFLSLESWRSFF